MRPTETNMLIFLFVLSSFFLVILAFGTSFFVRYRKTRRLQLLLATIIMFTENFGMICMLSDAAFATDPTTILTPMLKPSMLLSCLPVFLLLFAYLILNKRPTFLSLRRVLLFLAPFVLWTASYAIFIEDETQMTSLLDLPAVILNGDVLMKLLFCLIVFCYCCVTCFLRSDGSGENLPAGLQSAMDALTLICPFTFVFGLHFGIFPITILHFLILLSIDGLMFYTEFYAVGSPNPAKPSPVQSPSADDTDINFFSRAGQFWKDPEMTAPVLAAKLGTNRNYLSGKIKDLGFTGYNDLVNHKRVQYICRALAEDGHGDIIQIMYEAGFRSRSTASAAFKSIMGCTPTEYIGQLETSSKNDLSKFPPPQQTGRNRGNA